MKTPAIPLANLQLSTFVSLAVWPFPFDPAPGNDASCNHATQNQGNGPGKVLWCYVVQPQSQESAPHGGHCNRPADDSEGTKPAQGANSGLIPCALHALGTAPYVFC